MKFDWKIKTAIALVVLIAAGVYGYQYYQGQQAAKKAAAVETTPVVRMNLKSTVSATGTIKPVNSVEVSSKVTARIKDVLVKENDTVTAGQTIATLDATDYTEKRNQAQYKVANTKAKYERAQYLYSIGADTQEQFMHILEYYGQDPYIIRSSSILEDGFGNAFAGKYESVFCVNRGSIEERLDEFEKAIKTVYASSMSLSALDYRKRRGLDERDEQMALLIQRVSGSYYGSNYMPCAAGVGYSYSPYRIMKDSDPCAGMLRLVMGLGTSAVDRTEGSYPRIVNLDMPQKTSYSSSADKHRFSQGKAEVIDMNEKMLKKLPLEKMESDIPSYLERILLEHDYDAESRLREMGQRREVRFISCKGLVENNTLMEQMRRMLACIQEEYEYPVDTEFTINISQSKEYSVDLLQCRPLQVLKTAGGTVIPDNIDENSILLESRGSSMGMCRTTSLDIIVYVDAVKYYSMPYKEKDLVAKLIGKINWHYRDLNKHMMLIVPGRVGTTSPELGVPTAFSDISAYEIICETEENRAGYNPELSYGSHIFQDLVEARILYTAVFNNEKTIHFEPERLSSSRDIVGEFDQSPALEGIVHVYDLSDRKCEVYNDIANEHLLITC